MVKRINHIDRLKGLAIILVVMGHIYTFSMHGSTSIVGTFIGSFHMALFMYLSGYVACYGVCNPFWNYTKLGKKILGLLLPMFVFGLLFTMTFSKYNTTDDNFHLLVSFINAPAKNGYWYLMSLSVFYVSLQFFKLNVWNSKLVELIITCLTYITIMIGWKYTSQVNDPFCLLNCGNFYLFFIAGVFSRKYNWVQWIVKQNWLFTFSIIGYVALFNNEIPIHAIDSICRHWIVPTCAVIVLLIIFVNRENCDSLIERLMSFIGRNTLDVYVLHYFIVSNINLVVVDQWLESSDNFILSALLSFVLAVLITFVTILAGNILHKSIFIEKFVYGRF